MINEERNKSPTGRIGEPSSNIKDYIRKQIEKRFGSSLYGFRLPPSSTSMAAHNLRKKRTGKTPSEKKSFVETLRK